MLRGQECVDCTPIFRLRPLRWSRFAIVWTRGTNFSHAANKSPSRERDLLRFFKVQQSQEYTHTQIFPFYYGNPLCRLEKVGVHKYMYTNTHGSLFSTLCVLTFYCAADIILFGTFPLPGPRKVTVRLKA